MYITINEETNVTGFNLNNAKPGMLFEEIIDKMGYGEIEEISSATQTKTQYVLKYVMDELEYNFVSDSELGDHTELYIALSES